jgi:uncharacterized protein HemY
MLSDMRKNEKMEINLQIMGQKINYKCSECKERSITISFIFMTVITLVIMVIIPVLGYLIHKIQP